MSETPSLCFVLQCNDLKGLKTKENIFLCSLGGYLFPWNVFFSWGWGVFQLLVGIF